jgi:hypothetical protein
MRAKNQGGYTSLPEAHQLFEDGERLYGALSHLSNVLNDGKLGVRTDRKRALGLYFFQRGNRLCSILPRRLAAGQGHAVAQVNLGCMFEHGEGVVQDYAEAVRLYLLATAKGHPDDLNKLFQNTNIKGLPGLRQCDLTALQRRKHMKTLHTTCAACFRTAMALTMLRPRDWTDSLSHRDMPAPRIIISDALKQSGALRSSGHLVRSVAALAASKQLA